MHDAYVWREALASRWVTDPAQYSQYTSGSRPTRRPQLHAIRLRSIPQHRSISLFGWGSSKSPDEFTKAHPQSTTTSPSQTVDSAASQPTPDSIRTVKASHSTSDAADPNSPNVVEPDALQNIEKSILQAQDTTSAATVSETPELASIPEGIGYLKEVCGLDFGWGPTSLIQFVLEHIHITAGLSWSASIIALAFVIRGSIFPMTLAASSMTAKFQEISPVIKDLREKSTEALANNDKNTALEVQMQIREIHKETGISFVKMFRPMFFQIPLGYGAWHFLRLSSAVPVPAFETEQWLWITNLATGDPLYILPVLTALLTWTNLNTTQSSQTTEVPGMSAVKNFLPLITGGFMLIQPASVQIYFLVNGILTQLQMSSLQRNSFRRFLKLHPLPDKGPKPAADTPFSRMNFSPKIINTTARTTTTPGPTPPPPPPAPKSSIIDRGVESFQGMGARSWRGMIGSTVEKQEAKAKKKKIQAQKDAATRYEHQRRQDGQSQRAYRNAQGGQSREKSG